MDKASRCGTDAHFYSWDPNLDSRVKDTKIIFYFYLSHENLLAKIYVQIFT
jgi:hypothetical protein